VNPGGAGSDADAAEEAGDAGDIEDMVGVLQGDPEWRRHQFNEDGSAQVTPRHWL
jgi:hypothetical protein